MNQGSTASIMVTVSSINGFDLSVGMTTSVSSNVASLLIAAFTTNVITPSSFGKAESVLTITSLTGTPSGSYQITIASSGGTRSHTTIVNVTVGPADFTMLASPSYITAVQGSFNTTTITLTSTGGFNGNVSLTATTPLDVIGIAGGPSPVHLIAGGAATSTVSIEPSALTSPGTYTITVAGTSGGITHIIDITVTVQAPPIVRESMSLDSYSFNSSTSATLFLRNTGTSNITLVPYYVKDTSGNQYSRTGWSVPSILPSIAAPTIFTIGASYSSCTLSGSAFTFQAGHSYTIIVVTSRNNQFTFTVVR